VVDGGMQGQALALMHLLCAAASCICASCYWLTAWRTNTPPRCHSCGAIIWIGALPW
jgi:hypothetical protein